MPRDWVRLAWNSEISNLNITFDILTGHGHTITLSLRLQSDCNAYFNQVADLAFKGLKAHSPRDSSAYFCNLAQQSGESFPDFLSCTTEAVERPVDAGPARDMFIKQLAWEGLNTPTSNAVGVIRNDDTHKWVVDTHGIWTLV